MTNRINCTLPLRPQKFTVLKGVFVLLVSLLMGTEIAYGQQAPGNVGGGDFRYWFRADVGNNCVVANPVNCTPTGTWNSAGSSVSGNAVLNVSGNTNYVIPAINFNEVINTNNSHITFDRDGALGNSQTFFVVFKTASTATGASPDLEPAIIGGAVGDNRDVFYLTINDGTIKYNQTNNTPTIETLAASGSYNDDKGHLVTVSRERGNSDPVLLWVDGRDSVLLANGNGRDQNDADSLAFGLHSETGNGQLNADFAEIVIYSRLLTENERYRVETYLAGKYGLSLPHDYLSPASTIVYDVDEVYKNDIVGVFVESGAGTAGVIQSQAFSQDEGFGPLTLMYGSNYNGTIPLEMYQNSRLPGANDYFYMGHNGGSSQFTCDFNGTPLNRMERVFKTMNTGMTAATDSIALVFNNSANGIYNTLVSGTSYQLVVSSDPNFTVAPTTHNLVDHGGNKFSVELRAPTGTNYWSVVTLSPAVSAGFPNPGGINDCNLLDGEFLWYRGDTGISCAGYLSGTACGYASTDLWLDQSQFTANAFSFSPGTTEFPSWAPSQLNFNGGFNLDTIGVEEPHFFVAMPSPEAYREEVTVVAVLKTDETRTGASLAVDPTIVGADRGGGAGDGDFFLTMNNGVVNWGIHPTGQTVSTIASTAPAGTYNSDEPFLVLADRSNFGGGSMNMYINGTQQGAGLTGVLGTLDNLSTGSNGVFIGRADGTGGHMEADFGEVLVFDGVLTQNERERLQSYLAIKYGLSVNHNYLDFAGNVIYDITSFDNGIVGLGREDASGSGYYQKQTQSVVDTMLTLALGQYGGGTIPANNFLNTSSNFSANEYFIMGHNGGDNGFDSTYNFVPNSAMNRIYKMTETGSAGDPVTIMVETTPGGFYAGLTTDYAVVISSDLSFGLPADQVYQFQQGGGDTLYVEIPIPANTNFMTIVDLEAPTPAANPGGADGQNLSLWLRADTGHANVNIGGFNSGTWFDNSYRGNYGTFSPTPMETEVVGMNFNESINSGALGANVGFRRTSGDDLSIAIVFSSENQDPFNTSYDSHAALMGGRTIGSGDEYYLTMSGQDIHWVIENNLAAPSVISSSLGDLGDGLPHIVFVDRDQTSGDLTMRVDGATFGPITSANLNSLLASDSLTLAIQPQAPGIRELNAKYGEVIIFDSLISGDDQEDLLSYLAIKYGVTLDQDYYDKDHSNIFGRGVYTNRIFGIGTESLAGANFSQSVSRSAESGALTLVSGFNHMDTIPVSNDSNQVNALQAGEFLIIGDDGGNGDFTDALIGNTDQLLDRVWKANETGNLGTMTLYFDAAEIPGLVSPGNYSFIHSDDNTFDANDAFRDLIDIGGGIHKVEFNFADADETFFTLIRHPSPGAVTSVEMRRWLDANYGANIAGSGINWQPRAGIDQGFSQNVTPIIGGANFNRSIQLGTDHIAIERDQAAEFSMFVVFKSDNSTQGTGVYAGPAIMGGATALSGNNFGLYLDGTDLAWNTNENSNSVIVNNNARNYNDGIYYIAYVDFHNDSTDRVLGVDGVYSTQSGFTGIGLNQTDSIRLGRFAPAMGTPLMTGDIAEYIEFDLPLDSMDRGMVNSYLAIKYGITLPTDYVRAGTGAVLYNVAGYGEEIVGIAKDTTTFLDQRASQPARNSDGLGIVFGPTAGFPASNAGVANPLAEGSFLLVGHDGGATTQTGNFDTLTNKTMGRIYQVQTVGMSGPIDATFIFNGDFTMLSNGTTSDSSFVMLVSTTPTFDITSTSVPMTGVNDSVYTSYFDFPPNSIRYVTISKEINPSTPGGLTTPFSVWVRANTDYADNTGITPDIWTNQALNGNNVEGQTSGNTAGISGTEQLNFNPFVELDPLSQEMATQANILAGTMIGVVRVTSGDSLPGLMGQAGGSINWGLRGPSTFTSTQVVQGDPLSTNDFSARGELWANGAVPSSSINVGNWAIVMANTDFIRNESFYLGGYDPNPALTYTSYDFAEVIVFEDALFYADSIEKVETYLALKYGITLERSYISTNEDTLFSIFSDAEYFHDVAGIGRADTTSLRQKQSKSINNGSIVTIGLNDIQSSNGANAVDFPSDETWLVWGHNDESTCWTNVNFDVGPDPSGSRNHYYRMDRQWKTNKIGPLDDIEFLVDTASFIGVQPAQGSREYLLALDDDGIFDTNSLLIPMIDDTVNLGSISAIFDGDSLDNYPYFTIAARTLGPDFRQRDYCGGEIITMYGSNLDSNNLQCGIFLLNDGISTDTIYRGLTPTTTTFAVVLPAGSGDCLDEVEFVADPNLASNRIYEVSFLRDTSSSQSFPCTTGGTYDYGLNYPVVDSITIGVGGNPFFDYTDSLYCVGAGSILPATLANPLGLFYTVDAAQMPINTFGLIGDSTSGLLYLTGGVTGQHFIAHDLLGYCPTDSIWYDTISIAQPMNTSFSYAASNICRGDTVTMVSSPPMVSGTYSSVPNLVSLDILTGTFDPMVNTPGVYTITFQPDDADCYNSHAEVITIDTFLVADFSYPDAAYCPMSGDAVPDIVFLPQGVGWTFGSDSSNVTIDPLTGYVDLTLSDENTTHTVYYAPPSISCADTFEVQITIASLPNVNFAPQPGYCTNDLPVSLNPEPGTFLIGSPSATDTAYFSSFPGFFNFNGQELNNALVTGGPFPIFYHRDSTVSPGIVCSDSMAMLVNITGLPAEGLFYPDSITGLGGSILNYGYCVGEDDPFPIFTTTPAGGTFFSSDPGNLVVIADSGRIDLSMSTPGANDTIKYTFGTAGCIDTIDVGIIRILDPPDSSFVMNDSLVCENAGSIIVTPTNNSGQFYYWDGLNQPQGPIAGASGTIPVNALTAGVTYTVFYVTSQSSGSFACEDTSAFDYVTVVALDDASFLYNNGAVICNNQELVNPAILGTTGGIFSTDSTALGLDPMTGEITALPDTSIVGTYPVQYTTGGFCPDSTTVNLQIELGQIADLSYSSNVVCNDVQQLIPIISDTTVLDSFFSDPVISGLIPDPATGVLDLTVINSDTTIVITRIVTGNSASCPGTADFRLTVNVFLNNLSIDYPFDEYCGRNDTITPIVSGIPISELENGEFKPRAGLAYSNDTLGEIDLGSSSPNRQYVIEYVRSEGCLESATDTFFLRALDDPTFVYAPSLVCEGSIAIDSLDSALVSPGIFTSQGGVGSILSWIDPIEGIIDVANSPPDVYTITYTTTGPCPDSIRLNYTIAVQPVLDSTNVVISPPGAEVCGDQSILFEIQEPGSVDWRLDSSTAGSNNRFFILDNPQDGVVVTGIVTNSAGCSDSIAIPVQRKVVPDGEPTTWPSVLTGDLPLEILMASFSDSTSFIWEAESSDNIELEIETDTSEIIQAGSQTTLLNSITLDSDFNPGTVTYYITPYALGCFGDPDTLEINVNPNNSPIFIPGVMTPNGDTYNDTWQVQWSSDVSPDDYTIILYNRAGGEVFRMSPIHPNFTGGSLPDGVYWWILNGPDGTNELAGGLTIRRR